MSRQTEAIDKALRDSYKANRYGDRVQLSPQVRDEIIKGARTGGFNNFVSRDVVHDAAYTGGGWSEYRGNGGSSSDEAGGCGKQAVLLFSLTGVSGLLALAVTIINRICC